MDERSKPTRRRFLMGAGAAGGAGLAAVALAGARTAAPTPAATAAPAAPAEEPAGKGYRMSEHVRRYYRTTMV